MRVGVRWRAGADSWGRWVGCGQMGAGARWGQRADRSRGRWGTEGWGQMGWGQIYGRRGQMGMGPDGSRGQMGSGMGWGLSGSSCPYLGPISI